MNVLDSLRREITALSSEGRGKILAAVGGSSFLFFGIQMIYPVLLPHLRAAYGLDLATAGFLITVLWTTNAVWQLPAGYLTDRLGERAILSASAFLAAGSLLIVAIAASPFVLYVATVLVGVTIALNTIARYAALAKYYPKKLGAANGVTLAAADGGQALLPPIASVLAAAIAWQIGFGFTIPFFLVVALWLWVALPSTRPSSGIGTESNSEATESPDAGSKPESDGVFDTLRTVVASTNRASIRYGSVVLLIYMCLWVLFTGFYPTYLIEEKGFTTTVASSLFGLFFAVGILVKPVVGGAYDRVGLNRTLPVLVGIPGLLIGALPLLEGTIPFVLATIFIAPVLGTGTVIMSYLLEHFPDEIRGTGFGAVRTLTLLIAGLSPVVFGAAADRGFFDEGMIFLAAFALAIIPITVLVPPSRS